ncbi:Cdc6-related protein [Plesiocystis pacifica SIR-1]|uniref:Cdc6-related protein n=1 Tax=Plesiocystis pacifica SIR-1 TaxID=391625 RepID=A6G177_9BACT|nr:Cdc6-related protein [Plesiocystis pacifica SIR-1]
MMAGLALVVFVVLAGVPVLAGPPPAELDGEGDAGAETGGEQADSPESGSVDGEEAEGTPEGPDPAPGSDQEPGPAEAVDPIPGATLEITEVLRARTKALSERAEGIEALMRGQLDPSRDLDALFVLDLSQDDAGPDLRSLLSDAVARPEPNAEEGAPEGESTREPTEPAAAPEQEPEPAEAPSAEEAARAALVAAEARLERAYRDFLSLPADQRAARVAEHRAARARWSKGRAAEANARTRLERMKTQAEQLEALINEELDVAIDPTALLRINLADPSEIAGDDRRLRQALGIPDPPPEPEPAPEKKGRKSKKKQPEPEPEPAEPPAWTPEPELAAELEQAAAELDRQRLAFWDLGPEGRRARLESHLRRKEEAEKAAEVADLIADVDVETETVEDEISEAEREAAELRLAREQAEAAAEQARSEAVRRVTSERARLLRIKESHALFRAELNRERLEAIAAHDVALELDGRVNALGVRYRSPDPADREGLAAEVDPLYGELREALVEARDDLRASLDRIGDGRSGVEDVGAPLDGLPEGVELGDLDELRGELVATVEELRELESETLWSAAKEQRDDIVRLNDARLELLEMGSRELRARMTGFGADGVAQVRKEIDQIGLELRFRLLSLPRIGRDLLEEFERAPMSVLFDLLKVAVALTLFRSWRRRGDELTEALLRNAQEQVEAAAREGSRDASGLYYASLWYLGRIRRPLEWLLLIAFVYFALLAEREVQEFEILWLVALWVLLGLTAILTIDAVATRDNAERQRTRTKTLAELRLRSLRLVGMTAATAGLVLSLTVELVGRGAIFYWVGSSIWAVAVLIFVVLIRWWREPVFKRVGDERDVPANVLVRWVRNNTEGWTSFPAAAVGASYMLTRGLWRWGLRQAQALEVTRHLQGWLFRREVERQASARGREDVDTAVLDPAIFARFEPKGREGPEEVRLDTIASAALESIVGLNLSRQGSLSAIIGERGAGKSAFLTRVGEALEAHADEGPPLPPDARESDGSAPTHAEYGRLTVRRLRCPAGGFSALEGALGEALGLPPRSSRAAVVEAIADQRPVVFLIDDAHRLVRPAIGGLGDLDRLAEFTREVRSHASWVASLGAASWRFISRARGERVFFDRVCELAPWTEEQIGELIQRRCESAKVAPMFDEVVIPRQFDVATVGVGEGDRQLSELERAELGYYRVLRNYTEGNPAIALQCWRESLVPHQTFGPRRADDPDEAEGEAALPVRVRLFREPPTRELDEVGANVHFVLRAIVQLALADEPAVVDCTQLPPAEVADTIRFALAQGWVEEFEGYYRVTWHWYRAITNVLRRQHLLTM